MVYLFGKKILNAHILYTSNRVTRTKNTSHKHTARMKLEKYKSKGTESISEEKRR